MSEIRIPQSTPFIGVTKDGKAMNMQTKKWLSLSDNGHGYKQVFIMVNGKRYVRYIHRLVAECFLPNPNGLPEVNHLDGDKANNNAENLEWCTTSDNHRHAYEKGLKPRTTPKQQSAARKNIKIMVEARREGWIRWSKTPQAREQWIKNLSGSGDKRA